MTATGRIGKRTTLRGPCIGKAGAVLSFLACCAFAVSLPFENAGDGTPRQRIEMAHAATQTQLFYFSHPEHELIILLLPFSLEMKVKKLYL